MAISKYFVCSIAFALALLLSACTAQPPQPTQSPTRSIVFIAVDDLRNWVNYAGDYPGTVHTPNIDKLAAVATRYLNAYTPMPQCVAARTSVMFGLSPATHGITSLSWEQSDPDFRAIYDNPSMITLPETLSASGYHSAAAGKVFNSQLPGRWDETGPAIVFSEFYSAFDPGPDNTFIKPEVLPDTDVHPDQRVADWGADFLHSYPGTQAGVEGRPFFLALGFYQPHLPWRVPQAYFDLYPLDEVVTPVAVAGDLDDVPAKGVEYANNPVFGDFTQYEAIEHAGKATEYTQAYLASISHTDAMVGQVLEALALSPYAGKVDIILWSDHGFHLGEKFHWRKLTFWEQAVKVPLLVSSPGNTNYPVGDVVEEVSLVDLAATVVDLAGLPPVGQFEGAPLHDAANRSPAEIYLNDGMATVDNRIKIIDYDLHRSGKSDRSSYDLASDPGELVNRPPPGC